MAFIKRAKRPFTSFTNDPSVSKKTHSSIITVSLWSLTTIHWLTAQAAAYRLWKLPAHFEIHNAEEKARSPSSAVRKDRLGKRGTSWGRLSQLREAGWGNGGGREGAGRGFSPRKGSQVSGLAPDRLPGGSPPEVTTPGRLDSRASLGPRESQRHPLSDMRLQAPSPTRRPGSPHPDPHGEGHRSPHRARFAPGVPRPAASLGSPGSPAPAGRLPLTGCTGR